MEWQPINNNLQPACIIDGHRRSKSRTHTLVDTLPPASRHIRAAAFSTANPRLPRTPAVAHDARWWPYQKEATSASCASLSSNTLNAWESIRAGTVEKLMPASGPLCERRSALSSSASLGIKSCSRNCPPWLRPRAAHLHVDLLARNPRRSSG